MPWFANRFTSGLADAIYFTSPTIAGNYRQYIHLYELGLVALAIVVTMGQNDELADRSAGYHVKLD